jgi:TolB-like protein
LLEAEQYAAARDAFQAGLAVAPGDHDALLGLGAAFEGLGQLDSARAVYQQLAAADLPGRVRSQLAGRQQVLTRLELEARARQAVEQEAQLSQLPVEPSVYAVFPFRYSGRREELRPLERGLAHVFVTDLSRISALRLVERQQVQFIVEELQLVEQGRVDPASGARSGRLLRAGQVVQGQLGDIAGSQQLRLDVSVVRTATTEIAATGSAADRLAAIFDMEKAVLFELVERLGLVLTPAEREALAERPTANLQAFLAFSRGLEAEDRGDFAQAAAEYREASNLDPSFEAAAQGEVSADEMALAVALPLPVVAELMAPAPQAAPTGGFLTDNLNSIIPTGMTLGQQIQAPQGILPPANPNQLGELVGGGQVTPPGSFGTLVIVIRRPQ